MVKLDKQTKRRLVDLCKKENDEAIKQELEARGGDFLNISKNSIMVIPCNRRKMQRIIKKTLKMLPQEYTMNIHEILDGKNLTPIAYQGITFEWVYMTEHSLLNTLYALSHLDKGYYS